LPRPPAVAVRARLQIEAHAPLLMQPAERGVEPPPEEPEDLAEVPCPLCLHPMSDEAIARLVRTREYRLEPETEEGE